MKNPPDTPAGCRIVRYAIRGPPPKCALNYKKIVSGLSSCAIDVRAKRTKLIPLNWVDLKRLAEWSCCLRRPERWHRLARRSGSRPWRRRWDLGAQVLIGSLGNG